MAVPKVEVLLQPSDDVAGLDAVAQTLRVSVSLLVGQFAKVGRALARLGLDVVEIGLE